MSLTERITSLLPGGGPSAPVGTVHVVDPSPYNWLWINYHVVEELVRVNHDGVIEPAAMTGYRWVDDTTLEVDVREGETFPDGEPLTAASVKRAFDELIPHTAPHPPGTGFNHDPRTRCEVAGPSTVRFLLPEPDGLTLGKLRAMHVMSTRFWEEVGFGVARTGTGEGHW